MDARYDPPKLVLFSGAVQSACGAAQSAIGPFYCPDDQKVYLDLAFFSELAQRFGAPGDFAQAYVIAHEVGHHVQDELGITRKVDRAAAPGGPRRRPTQLSVTVELQADCLAGVWAHHANQNAASCSSPATSRRRSTPRPRSATTGCRSRRSGYVVPDSFTHGSSAQRVRWFRRGFESGDIGQCNTFGAPQL